jgi:hypothetical protein
MKSQVEQSTDEYARRISLRFPEAGQRHLVATAPAFREGPKPVVSRRSNLRVKEAELFDHLIGRHPYDQRYRKAEHLKGLQIDR